MEQSMTPHQALQILKQCAEQVSLPYAQHVVVQHAVLTLHHALEENDEKRELAQ